MTIMIQTGDNPQQIKDINKFLTKKDHEGVRGKIIAVNKSANEAIMVCFHDSFDNDVKWGKLYLVREDIPEHYPELVRRVKEIPEGFNIL